MRDPDALHIGATVQTPNGPGIIRARRAGVITTWLVMDFWWRESQLTSLAYAVPTGISPQCKRGAHGLCGEGYMDAGTPTECVCRCGHPESKPGRPRYAMRAEDE